MTDTLPPVPPPAPERQKIDPRLLAKALKKMQGLVRGNGLKTDQVTLIDTPPDTDISMYRFAARTVLKLAPEYGTKTEAGRHTKGELMPTQEDFNKALSKLVVDARTIPDQRKQIVDYLFSRTDKGFGIKEQRIKFHTLARDFVMHEKCVTCKNTGRTGCAKCQGHGVLTCVNCQGRRQVVCPRCRGTTKIHANGKILPCPHCRADGKINCPKCAGRGQIKCQTCAASGSLQCQPCAGTGWISHLSHIDVYAQIFFDFNREGLPPPLVQEIEHNASRLVEKNAIEVALKQQPQQQPRPDDKNAEPDDTLWLDYDALCPYGPIGFKLKDRVVSANLLGFGAQLYDAPAFLDDLTRIGQQALASAAKGQGDVAAKIRRAARYAYLRDVLVQTLRLKNPQKATTLILSKYTAGIKAETVLSLTLACDKALQHITRKPRLWGLGGGEILFALLCWGYFIGGLRLMLPVPPGPFLWAVDAALLGIGILCGTLGSQLLSLLARNKALKGIIPDDILARILPRVGNIFWVATGLSVFIFFLIIFLAGQFYSPQSVPLPEWVLQVFLPFSPKS